MGETPWDLEKYKFLVVKVEWLNQNRDVFVAYKASLGFVWA